ncbi:hypothetical protein HPB49_019493 [Dermacentor silvarum]|uniref:Uncharacterized protein n=1 Tax=Dermacentor silvarum TaxID=543639 RepID=A0ACB8CSQ6_DERSI|nr:hypothetical protein HPB49_019493 [Dermacentor silvarum]
MGNTNSVLIVFDGKQVPYDVYYRGAEYKCYLHNKYIEVCDICGTVGHSADVCPTLTQKKWDSCDTLNPPAAHSAARTTRLVIRPAIAASRHPTSYSNDEGNAYDWNNKERTRRLGHRPLQVETQLSQHCSRRPKHKLPNAATHEDAAGFVDAAGLVDGASLVDAACLVEAGTHEVAVSHRDADTPEADRIQH